MKVSPEKTRVVNVKRRYLTKAETDRYGKSKRLRYLLGEPIYPIGYVQHKFARGKSRQTEVTKIDDLRIKLIGQPLYDRSIEYADNRIAKYTAQKGRCAVTGEKFTSTEEIHCHHKIPKSQGGTDEYENLILVTVKRWNTVCDESCLHGVEWGKIQRLFQRITYHYKSERFSAKVAIGCLVQLFVRTST